MFFTFLLPLVLLALLGMINVGDALGDRTDIKAINFVVPGVLAFAVVAAAYGNLATRIAVLRAEGVLKRIRTTPMDPRAYLLAHLVSSLITTMLVGVATILLGIVAFDVSPQAEGAAALTLGLALGIICFASLGLAWIHRCGGAEGVGASTRKAS